MASDPERRPPLQQARWAAAVTRSVVRWTRLLRPWIPSRTEAASGAVRLLARSTGLRVSAPVYRFQLSHGRYAIRIGTWHELACALEVLRADDYVQPGLQPGTVLDLGANVGVATALFRDLYPEAAIVAVEPAADTFALLEENVGTLAGVTARRVAVGPAGLVSLDPSVPPTARQPQPTDRRSSASVERVPLGTLLDHLGWATADLVKIDIEGDEFAVFADPSIVRCDAIVGELHLAKAPPGFTAETMLPDFDVDLRPSPDGDGYLTFRAVRR